MDIGKSDKLRKLLQLNNVKPIVQPTRDELSAALVEIAQQMIDVTDAVIELADTVEALLEAQSKGGE